MRLTPLAGLLAALVLGGCSSGGETAPPATTPSTSAPSPADDTSDDTADTTADTTAGDTDADTDAARVCDLLAPADYKRFIRRDLRGRTYEKYALDGQLGTMHTCQVWTANFRLFTFGYTTDPGAWATIERRTRPDRVPRGGDPALRKLAVQTAQKREELPNLGQEAYFSYGFGFTELFALNDDVSYYLSPSSLVSSGRDSVLDYMAVMIEMTSKAADGVRSEPVQLPPQCPAADSPAVTDAIGEVAYAAGGAYEGLAPTCDYLAADGRTLSAGSTFFGSKANYAREAVLPETLDRIEMLDTPRGRTAGVRRTRGDWTYHSALPARLETVSVTTGRTTWGPRPEGSIDRKAFLAFVDAYRALASEQLGAAY